MFFLPRYNTCSRRQQIPACTCTSNDWTRPWRIRLEASTPRTNFDASRVDELSHCKRTRCHTFGTFRQSIDRRIYSMKNFLSQLKLKMTIFLPEEWLDWVDLILIEAGDILHIPLCDSHTHRRLVAERSLAYRNMPRLVDLQSSWRIIHQNGLDMWSGRASVRQTLCLGRM